MYFAHALKSNGESWAWGVNETGQLGKNNVTVYSSPVAVVGWHAFIDVAANNYSNLNYGSCLGLKIDGTAWAWGYNPYGQLGTGNRTNYSSPVSVIGSHVFIRVRSGCNHSLFHKADGSIWACGYNATGQLGNNSTTSRSSPVLVVGGHSFTRMAGSIGGWHSLALKANGECWTWGWNSNGQLGDGTITDRSSPVLVVGGHSFIKVAAGYLHSLGLKADGSVWAWGDNTSGGLGNNSRTDRSSPVLVVGSHSFIDIKASNLFSLGLKANGQIWSWGYNGNAALGTNNLTSYSSPVLVVGSHSFILMSTGREHCQALKENGEVWSWGIGSWGDIGNGTTFSYSSPVLVIGNHVFSNLMNNSSYDLGIPIITNIDNEKFLTNQTNITISGMLFLDVQGIGKVEIGDNIIYASATKNTLEVNSWSGTSININMSLGIVPEGSLWIFVTNNDSVTSLGYPVFVSNVLTWGKETIGATNTAFTDSTRVMGGTSPDIDNMVLRGVAYHFGANHVTQLRLAVYSGGDLAAGPAGANLLHDFGLTTGSATNAWFIKEYLGNDILIPKNAPLWISMKANEATSNITLSSIAGVEFQSARGRWNSVSVSTDEAVAYPATWPDDAGSFQNYWYDVYLLYSIQLGFYGIRLKADSTQSLASVSNFTPSANCSVSFWINNFDARAIGGYILGHSANWKIYMTTGRKIVNLLNGGTAFLSVRSINVGTLYHVVMTRASDNSRKIYINGILDNSDSAGNGATGAAVLYIGMKEDSTLYFDGYLEDIRIYNRVLSLQEIQTIYACPGMDNIVYGLLNRFMLNESHQGATAGGAGFIKDCGSSQINMTPANSPEYTGSRIRSKGFI
jgi:alpha-tubulin suppressor-like RCC1 family protein